MRRLLIAVAVLFAAGTAGTALAFSRCDVGVIKAKGQIVSCECAAIVRGLRANTPPQTIKCQLKFNSACAKAQGAGDCVTQTKSCGDEHLAADAFVIARCENSPSGAFLN
jgi:hypothetical protein